MRNIFDNLIYSLNQIEVHGKKNLDILLGCIMTLEKLKGMVKTETTTVNEQEAKKEEESHVDDHDE